MSEHLPIPERESADGFGYDPPMVCRCGTPAEMPLRERTSGPLSRSPGRPTRFGWYLRTMSVLPVVIGVATIAACGGGGSATSENLAAQATAPGQRAATVGAANAEDSDPEADGEHHHVSADDDGTACHGELKETETVQQCWMTAGATTDGADSEQEYFVSVSENGFGPIDPADQAEAEKFQSDVQEFLLSVVQPSVAAQQGWSWGNLGHKLAFWDLKTSNEFLADITREPFLDHVANTRCAEDNKLLQPDCPEYLMYLTDGTKARLMGAMFIAPPGIKGPQFAGRASIWHFHVNENLCYAESGIVEFIQPVDPTDPNVRLPCPKGSTLVNSPQMLHVWLPGSNRAPLSGDMNVSGMSVEPSADEPVPYISTMYPQLWNVKPADDGTNRFVVLDPATTPRPG